MENLAVAVACPDPLLGARAVWLPGVADHSPIATCFRVRAFGVWFGAFLPLSRICSSAALSMALCHCVHWK
jgi:hypothetical protein